jgi:hypothetical protein
MVRFGFTAYLRPIFSGSQPSFAIFDTGSTLTDANMSSRSARPGRNPARCIGPMHAGWFFTIRQAIDTAARPSCGRTILVKL